MASDPKVTYVEVDLPGVVSVKRYIVEKIAPHSRLKVKEGDAFCLADLLAATDSFAKRPIAVVSEDLLRYLVEIRDKEVVAGNVLQLLKTFGGAWIWSDSTVCRRESFRALDKTIIDLDGVIKKNTGVDVNMAPIV